MPVGVELYIFGWALLSITIGRWNPVEFFVVDVSMSLRVPVYHSLRFLFTLPELAVKLILMLIKRHARHQQ